MALASCQAMLTQLGVSFDVRLPKPRRFSPLSPMRQFSTKLLIDISALIHDTFPIHQNERLSAHSPHWHTRIP